MRPTDALPHPPDWQTATVARAVHMKRGVSWSKDQEHTRPRSYTVPVIRVGNVQSKLLLDDMLYLSGLKQPIVEAKRVTAGWSIMVGSNGNRGRIGNAVFVQEAADYLFASFLLGAAPKEGSGLSPEFFFRWLTTEPVQGYLTASSEGTTGLSNLSPSFFRQMSVAFPELGEQRVITQALEAVDRVLDGAHVAATQGAAVKRALLSDLLRKGTRGEQLEKTATGMQPASWAVVPLKSLVRAFQYGLSMKMATSGNDPILRMGNIQNGRVVLDDLKYVSLAESLRARYLVARGDLLFNRTNSQELVGKVGIYRSDEPAVFASYLIRVLPDSSKVDNYFLGHVLNSYAAQCRIKRYATPGVQQVNVNAKNLGRVLIPLPVGDGAREEQQRIAAVLECADEAAHAYGPFIERLEALKTSLTRELMTGAVRVPVPDGAVTAT